MHHTNCVRRLELALALLLSMSLAGLWPIAHPTTTQSTPLPVYVANSSPAPTGDGGGGHMGG